MQNFRDPLHPDRLRDILEPRPEAVERIVRQALAAPAVDVPRWIPTLAAATVAMAGLAAAALLFAWQLGRFRFEPERRPAAISIVNEGGILIATSPSGDWLVRSAEPEPEPESPGIIIISHGGTEK
jgi:hypothetical protein